MKVDELTGTELDYWVAMALGWGWDQFSDGTWYLVKGDGTPLDEYGWSPSTQWDQGGMIIEREGITITPLGYAEDGRPQGGWRAAAAQGRPRKAPTALGAAMRCFVAAKFGEQVSDDAHRGVMPSMSLSAED